MEKSRGDSLLEARLSDALRMAEQKNRRAFLGFFDEREAALARAFLRRSRCENFLLWGGHEEAERVMLGVFPDYQEPEASPLPLAALTVSYRKEDVLTHRDFLGALLACGVERASLGDILVGEGRAVLFAREEIAPFLAEQVEKIGRVGVRLALGAQEPYPAAHRYEDFSAGVAPPRLDCVVAAAAGLSREKAAALVSSGLVVLNYKEETSSSAQVEEGAKLSIRGKGKFVVDRLGPLTKKGRLCISGRKYV